MDYATRRKAVYEKTFAELTAAQTKLAIYQVAAPILKSFEGKKITKRIATAIKDALPEDMVVVLSWSGAGVFSMGHIDIWGGSLGYDHRIHIYLGGPGELSAEKADISDWIKHTKEYIDRTSSALDNLDSLLVKHDVAMSMLNEAKEDCRNLEGLDWRI